MANSNEAFEGESTFELSKIDFITARQNGFNGVVSIQNNSKRLDFSDVAGCADIAPVFSEESTYSKDDPVYRNGVLYYAKSAIAAGEWDPSKWEHFPIGAKLAALQADVNNKLDGIETLLASI